jgi:hypothetical protein
MFGLPIAYCPAVISPRPVCVVNYFMMVGGFRDKGSRIKDQGSRFKGQGSRVKAKGKGQRAKGKGTVAATGLDEIFNPAQEKNKS